MIKRTDYKYATLPTAVLAVLADSSTEYPNYNKKSMPNYGLYLCRGCGISLFSSQAEFAAHCGWPAFDTAVKEHCEHITDPDGQRTEVRCAQCRGHLGHVFYGEGYTANNTRYCINRIALDWVAEEKISQSAEIILAAGCFWGLQQNIEAIQGVLGSEVGYTGGKVDMPTYQQVCSGDTGHVEAVRVLYNPKVCSLEHLLEKFYLTFNTQQVGGQGPDIGSQYLSVIFYENNHDRNVVIKSLEKLCTKIGETSINHQHASTFWPAESYHQYYYKKNINS